MPVDKAHLRDVLAALRADPVHADKTAAELHAYIHTDGTALGAATNGDFMAEMPDWPHQGGGGKSVWDYTEDSADDPEIINHPLTGDPLPFSRGAVCRALIRQRNRGEDVIINLDGSQAQGLLMLGVLYGIFTGALTAGGAFDLTVPGNKATNQAGLLIALGATSIAKKEDLEWAEIAHIQEALDVLDAPDAE